MSQASAPALSDIVVFFQALQDEICQALEALDGSSKFVEDLWNRAEGGGGRTRILQGGDLIEKGGVNFSHVHGPLPGLLQKTLNVSGGSHFHATGISIVLHPESPRQPIIHMNLRYFELDDGRHWFGGGIDLTPIYVVPADAIYFHQELKQVCDRFDPSYYPRFKSRCDEYFFLKHRQEMRGIGGVFFDQLRADNELQKVNHFAFVKDLGKTFMPLYREITGRHRQEKYGPVEQAFQSVRRSRYVEFNLVYDRGTRFGLETNGRIESILMSLPPQAKWVYNYQAEPGSPEAATLAQLQPRDWAGESSAG